MIDIVYSPRWFYGKDIIIDIVSIIVLSLIAYFSIKYYKVDKKNKNYLYLAISFILLGLSFLFKIITNFTIYYKILETKHLGLITLTYQSVKASNTLFFIGFLAYRLLTLLGLYALYSIYQKQPKSNILLIVYLIIIATYFSNSAYYIFHLTSLILLIFVTVRYFKNYKESRNKTTRLLAYSFGLITLSQIVFIFIKINPIFYVSAELIQLIGYIALLITFIMVLKHGKKKR